MKFLEYHEKIKRGTSDFPLEFYHISPSHPRYNMAYHWHMECELIRIIKGSLSLMIDNQHIIATEGDIIYIHDGALHGGDPKNCIYECIVFDMSYLFGDVKPAHGKIQKFRNNALLIQNYFPDAHPRIHEIIYSLFDCVRMKAAGFELTALGHLYRFYGYVIEHNYYSKAASIADKNSTRVLQLKNALTLIETQYQTNISLTELAMAANMNAKYFCRFFQEMTGRTPIDYLNHYRIEIACFQLATSSDSITDIAFNCGFNDLSYFIKTFKKYKGITPKKFLSSPL